MNKLFWSAVGLLVAVNSVVLGHSYYNRQEVNARITFSERELSLPDNYGFEKENSGINLSIRWSTRPNRTPENNYYYGRDLQLSPKHYSTFHFSGICNQEHQETNEQGFVLVEFNGNTHQQTIEQLKAQLKQLRQSEPGAQPGLTEKIKALADELLQFEHTRSRLYIIDAAVSKIALQETITKQERTPGNQFLILPAVISDAYTHCEGKQQNPNTIYIDELLVNPIYVPREYHALLSDKKLNKHFQATIAFGKLDEPWLESLVACEKECKAQ
ncbi:DUF4824 family protein [Cellvibrio mixtus]|uniref:DUF4824 family protein n=1 Tax=Cellvibrio mixtus TaxID=39650 RepID=UPI000587BE1E|nr:DUF4824 family protein [Cellvibrio mixtus]